MFFGFESNKSLKPQRIEKIVVFIPIPAYFVYKNYFFQKQAYLGAGKLEGPC